MTYEYKVVPAPVRGVKARGVRSNEDRFALALETAMNEIAADGWEYLRADILPCEQREGLMSKTTVYQNLLVFRRTKPAAATAPKGAPPPKPQKQALIAAPAVKVQKKVVTSDDKPSPDLAAE